MAAPFTSPCLAYFLPKLRRRECSMQPRAKINGSPQFPHAGDQRAMPWPHTRRKWPLKPTSVAILEFCNHIENLVGGNLHEYRVGVIVPLGNPCKIETGKFVFFAA